MVFRGPGDWRRAAFGNGLDEHGDEAGSAKNFSATETLQASVNSL